MAMYGPVGTGLKFRLALSQLASNSLNSEMKQLFVRKIVVYFLNRYGLFYLLIIRSIREVHRLLELFQ
jgi:hypothetical protein